MTSSFGASAGHKVVISMTFATRFSVMRLDAGLGESNAVIGGEQHDAVLPQWFHASPDVDAFGNDLAI
jgi:hypothetical protein